jgi:hypothetical protein
MYSVVASWLMTTLTTDPLMVSLVPSSLPGLIFAFPAGVLADMVNKRKFLLLIAEVSIAVLSTLFAFLVWRGLVGPQTHWGRRGIDCRPLPVGRTGIGAKGASRSGGRTE